jgi:DNA-binding PadR family transcriptional regulator
MSRGKTERYLGELEQMVLLAVLRLDDGAYGATVLDEIEARTGRSVSRGGLYVTLDRLVEKGLLAARMGEPTPERGGRAPRLVTVTAGGLAELRKSRRAFAGLTQGLEAVLEGEG